MARKLILSLMIMMLLAIRSEAQELEFSGYYENQFYPQELKDELILQDYSKLRLDLSAEVSENVSFNGDYVYKIYHGQTEFNAFDFIPESVVQKYAEEIQAPVDSLRPQFDFENEDEDFLDNAYVTMYFQYVDVRVGKQQLPWGTGYTWNPTDVFNDKNILDPTYEKTGVNAFKMEVPFSSEGMLTGILSIDDEWETSTKALKIKQHFWGFDFSGSFVEKNQEGFDYLALEETVEQRSMFGADFSGEVLGLGVWGEGAYNQMEESDDFGQYLIGIDYTFESEFYLMAEYYRNDLGESSEDGYDINDWMRLLDTVGVNLGQDYVFLMQRYPITELWNWSNYFLMNLNDESGMIYPWFDYSLNDNTELTFVGFIPFGDNDTEFGSFGYGGFARVRVYF